MSSLANAIKRKTHKERSQPLARRKYGLLEKHKDYVLRAKDFHRKEKAIKGLKRKAEERNPDEFYFAMENARTKNGVHLASTTAANKYSQAELALMKTQDGKYLELKARTAAERAAKMQRSLHFIGLPPANTHTVFVDSAREAQSFDAAQYFDTAPELVGRSYNRPRRAALTAEGGGGAPTALPASRLARMERRRAGAYKRLAQAADIGQKLQRLAAKAAADKAVMAPGRKRKLRPSELPEGAQRGAKAFRWKRERKK